MIVLDTNVVSELMRDQPAQKVSDWTNGQSRQSLFVAAISIAEILYGIRRLPTGRRRNRLEAALSVLMSQGFDERVLPFTAAAADHYSRVAVERQRQGRRLEAFDAMIAGTALAHDAQIATRDVADFADCGVTIINPWD